MKTLTLNLISGGTVDVEADAIRHLQAETKGTTVVVQHDGCAAAVIPRL